jgi:hypothetical protein
MVSGYRAEKIFWSPLHNHQKKSGDLVQQVTGRSRPGVLCRAALAVQSGRMGAKAGLKLL